MNFNLKDIINDPLFQLNSVLWLSQPLPESYEITPLFYKAGFKIHSIAPKLTLPLNIIISAEEAQIKIQGGCSPDVILENEAEKKYLLTECKKKSFGIESNTSEQARTLLLCVGDRSHEILGLDKNGVKGTSLAYFINKEFSQLLEETLGQLTAELSQNDLHPGSYSILGIGFDENKIFILIDKKAGKFLNIKEGINSFIKIYPTTDPRPLYFIPYDPSVEKSTYGREVLIERMLSTIIVAVGRVTPPTEVSFESERLLNDAMFGIYEHWEDRDSRTHMKRMCRNFIRALYRELNKIIENCFLEIDANTWCAKIMDDPQHEIILSALTSFSRENLAIEDSSNQMEIDELLGS